MDDGRHGLELSPAHHVFMHRVSFDMHPLMKNDCGVCPIGQLNVRFGQDVAQKTDAMAFQLNSTRQPLGSSRYWAAVSNGGKDSCEHNG